MKRCLKCNSEDTISGNTIYWEQPAFEFTCNSCGYWWRMMQRKNPFQQQHFPEIPDEKNEIKQIEYKIAAHLHNMIRLHEQYISDFSKDDCDGN